MCYTAKVLYFIFLIEKLFWKLGENRLRLTTLSEINVSFRWIILRIPLMNSVTTSPKNVFQLSQFIFYIYAITLILFKSASILKQNSFYSFISLFWKYKLHRSIDPKDCVINKCESVHLFVQDDKVVSSSSFPISHSGGSIDT